MKKRLTAICAGIILLGFAGLAQASLTTIGTATYGSTDYNLILDDSNNGNKVVWLDYTNNWTNWAAQNSWAPTLDSALTINTFGYDIDWGDSSWRLPTGFPTKEFDDLWTNEFGLSPGQGSGTNGNYTTEELKKEGFTHLTADSYYWTSTSYDSTYARYYSLHGGLEAIWQKKYSGYGLAIHTVNSVDTMPTPVPGAIWLLGSGLIGLVGLRRKKDQ